ncbi:hypothetical protein DPMN_026705 [Dreissena polymorpha]|uniref:Uncharacterized protein n=1 Tax=Dreissena polymorpha TaxID=45954 RepID=A0A9D4REV4_DREPO|nr:hypothetical protein DPMN_026705 [Dreissena polymorpha]
MAVYVEISKTKHLTYSPLNEKHNILYSRARTNVNQRHIQKPWFDLNPFLDREDHTAVSLERYRPEDDEGLLPLQSLVIVEDYSSDKPHYGKEFKIDEFWEHLFSKDWNNGYSLRVLEGRLQDLLITCLVTLIHGDRVTQHSTMAYAKNRRQRNSIYKPSQKKPELKPYEETLLLEFIYYGRVMKSNAHETEASSDGYPNVTTCSATTYVSSELETTDLDVAIFKEAYQPIPPASPLESSIHMRRHRLLCRRSTLDESDTNVTEVQVDSCVLQPIPRGSARQREYSSVYGTSSEDYRQLPPKINLENFACTEKVSYLGEFNLSDDSSGSDDEADNEDFGQQYYLGERKRVTPALTSTAEKLKQRKAIVVQERALKREQAQQNQVAPTRKSFMPEFSELDVAKYVRKSEMHINLEAHRRAEEAKVPELEEYVAIPEKGRTEKSSHVKKDAAISGAQRAVYQRQFGQ